MEFKMADSLLLISSLAFLQASLAYSQQVTQVQPGALNTSNVPVMNGGTTVSGNISLSGGGSITPGNIGSSAGGSIRTSQMTTTSFLTDNVVAINNISNQTGALVDGKLLTPVTANSVGNVGSGAVAINQGTIVLTGNAVVGYYPRVQPVGNPVIATRAVADSIGRISLIGTRSR
ncbi:MAG: hypothetical protein IPH41_15205 [Sulfuritalea sp.]|nr:hypothetical protein [Sulfuritalea sp.]